MKNHICISEFCLPISHFLTIIAFYLLFTYMNNKNVKIMKRNMEKKDINQEINKNKLDIIQKYLIKNTINNIRKHEFLKERDAKSLKDDLTPPERRLEKENYPYEIKNHINIPTRGHPDNYHHIGNLIRSTDEKVVQLMGRRKFPRSQQWDYYIISTDPNGLKTKIPLKVKGDKEIYDNDQIDIPFYNSDKGKFKVQLLEYDVPRYNPYLY